MAEYEAKGGCKRKLSDDIDDPTSSTGAAPPRKKTKRTKQVAKASRESEDEGGSDQEDDADADAAEEDISQEDARGEDEDGDDKPVQPVVRRAAATAAKKNISAVAKLSTSAYAEREDVKEQDSKDEKKKRTGKSSILGNTTPASSYHGIKQDDLKDDEDLLHTEFVSIAPRMNITIHCATIIISNSTYLSSISTVSSRHLSIPSSPGLHQGNAADVGAGTIPCLPCGASC